MKVKCTFKFLSVSFVLQFAQLFFYIPIVKLPRLFEHFVTYVNDEFLRNLVEVVKNRR